MARIPTDKEGRSGDPRTNRNAIVDRRPFESQLFDAQGKPTPVMYAFAGRMQKEVGDYPPEAQMAWAETVFNRCASRGNTLAYELRNNGRYSYWPKHQPEPGYSNNKQFVDIITKVCKNGTNLSLGATGNASGSVGAGRETYRSHNLRKTEVERMGVETPDTKWWNTKFGSLIRGVGKFIGDVVGAIGQGITAVAKGVVEVGKWVFNGIDNALHPRTQPAPHAPVHQNHGQPPAPHHQQPERQPQVQRQPELVQRIEHPAQPNPRVWKFNMDPEPNPTRAMAPEQKTETRPRPTSKA